MIRIRECGEPLVDIRNICPGVIIDLEPERMKREGTAYLRKTVADMLNRACWELPQGMTFILRDAWRPRHVQQDIFDAFMERFQRRQPDAAPEEIRKRVEQYVAPFEGPHVSGHMTGGAMDLRLWKQGKRIPMRSWELPYETNAATYPKELPNYLMRNREIMYKALSSVGLSNYPKEFWHWSYGDYWWAERNGKDTAIYGAVDRP